MSQEGFANAHSSAQPEPAQDGSRVGFREIDGSLPNIEALHLTPEMTCRLIERARKERTTVHGALSTALVLSGREFSGDWNHSPVGVRPPFSLRNSWGSVKIAASLFGAEAFR